MAPNRKIFALKRIRLTGRDAEAAAGFLDEITLLNRLRGRSNIIQLIDSEVHRSEALIFMVLEYGDIDLARLLQKQETARKERGTSSPDLPNTVDENFIRLYWQQMLQAVDTIHRERIVHSDLKPANFLVVEGQLKLIDFGIAKAIQSGECALFVKKKTRDDWSLTVFISFICDRYHIHCPGISGGDTELYVARGDSRRRIQRWEAPGQGRQGVRHLVAWLHFVPDGLRTHTLCPSSIHSKNARNHR